MIKSSNTKNYDDSIYKNLFAREHEAIIKLLLALLVLHLGSLKVHVCLKLYLHSFKDGKSFLSFEPLSLQILSKVLLQISL